MINVIRPALFFAASVLLSAISSSDRAHAQAPLKVRVGMVTVASQMAFDIAQKKGFFAKHGFDVEIRPLATGVQANQALAANQVDWAAGGVETTIIARSTHLPFKPFTMYAKGGDSLAILVRRDSGIKTLSDLKGKRIAVAAGTASAQGLNQVLKSVNLTADSVKRVNANFGNMGQMLIQGVVDAMVGLEPFLTLTEQKIGTDGAILVRLAKFVQGGGFFLISDAWAAAHPDKIEAAVEALWEAEKFIRDNPNEASAINAATLKTDAAIVSAAARWLTFDPTIDDFTLSSLKTSSSYLLSEKIIPEDVDVAALMATARKVEDRLKEKRPDLLK